MQNHPQFCGARSWEAIGASMAPLERSAVSRVLRPGVMAWSRPQGAPGLMPHGALQPSVTPRRAAQCTPDAPEESGPMGPL